MRCEARLATRWLGRPLIHHARVGSTNDVAWEASAAGAEPGTVVVADAQDAGRGRAGRAWHTAPGCGLALSALLGLPRPSGLLPLAAGVALARACAELGLATELKWPNDVLVRGRKLAGILCESRGSEHGALAVVGVGVNVADPPGSLPSDLASRGTSVAIEGVAASREDVAAAFLNAFEPLCEALAAGDGSRVLQAWSDRCGAWGRRVRVRAGEETLEGVAETLDPSGALVLRLADGSAHRVHAGDVELAPDADAGAGRHPEPGRPRAASEPTR